MKCRGATERRSRSTSFAVVTLRKYTLYTGNLLEIATAPLHSAIVITMVAFLGHLNQIEASVNPAKIIAIYSLTTTLIRLLHPPLITETSGLLIELPGWWQALPTCAPPSGCP